MAEIRLREQECNAFCARKRSEVRKISFALAYPRHVTVTSLSGWHQGYKTCLNRECARSTKKVAVISKV